MQNNMNFAVGQNVACNAELGTIQKIHVGQLAGMADVRLPGGLTTVALNELTPPKYDVRVFDIALVCVIPDNTANEQRFVRHAYADTLHSLIDGQHILDYRIGTISHKNELISLDLEEDLEDQTKMILGPKQLAQQFWSELNAAFSNLFHIGHVHRPATLVMCMHLQNAILNSGVVHVAGSEADQPGLLSTVDRLPSKDLWRRFIQFAA